VLTLLAYSPDFLIIPFPNIGPLTPDIIAKATTPADAGNGDGTGLEDSLNEDERFEENEAGNDGNEVMAEADADDENENCKEDEEDAGGGRCGRE